ncbi:MAG TPA: hypothetical protein VM283_03890 [Armatimonadota bacterium]|nr:hypothetical protein [Armatimonadota bacterium]
MATSADQCANRQINLLMCPCTSESCDRRGICCECVQAHYAKSSTTACMRGARRDPATMGLSSQAKTECPTNSARNLEFCVCTYVPCANKAVCCNCVRNHFTVDGAGRVACMR